MAVKVEIGALVSVVIWLCRDLVKLNLLVTVWCAMLVMVVLYFVLSVSRLTILLRTRAELILTMIRWVFRWTTLVDRIVILMLTRADTGLRVRPRIDVGILSIAILTVAIGHLVAWTTCLTPLLWLVTLLVTSFILVVVKVADTSMVTVSVVRWLIMVVYLDAMLNRRFNRAVRLCMVLMLLALMVIDSISWFRIMSRLTLCILIELLRSFRSLVATLGWL